MPPQCPHGEPQQPHVLHPGRGAPREALPGTSTEAAFPDPVQAVGLSLLKRGLTMWTLTSKR